MKKTINPVIMGIRLVFALTCIGALVAGIRVGVAEHRLAGTYFITAFTALVSLLLTHAPDIAKVKDSLMMPMAFQVVFSLFVFCAMFLGEMLDFYTRFIWWDLMLHFASGVMFSLVGLMLFTSLNRKKDVRSQLNPITIVLFAVCFSLACGVVWEIFEYAGDTLLGMNMQRWQSTVSGEEWSALQNVSNLSNPGLVNTMKDTIADALGSILSIAVIIPLVRHGNKYKKAEIPTEELLGEWQGAYAAILPGKEPATAPAAAMRTEAIRDDIEDGGYKVA